MANLPFQTIDKGHSSAIEETLSEVYRTQQEFEVFWGRHKAGSIPDVDFATRMVIAVYSGMKNSGGYSIEITSVDEKTAEEGGGIVVNYVTDTPSPGSMVTMALTQPYHIISVDASEKAVVFEGSAKPAAPPPAMQTLIVGFDEGYAPDDAMVARIEAFDHVTNVQVLSSMKMLFVDIDTRKMSKDEAQKLLEDIEGVKYVEADR